MSNLILARVLFAYSLGFHMIFAALGVGMPLLMFLAEAMWLKSHEQRYLELAKTWAKATGVLFAIGAVSGTAIAFEMGLLWPRFMAFAGATVGPAFALEGFAFFMEAIFLGLYLYGWKRLSPLAHALSGAVVAIAGASSSVLVVAANAWMQNPNGFEVIRSNPEVVNLAAVLFRNPAWGIMTLHSTISTYAATGFAVAGIYAWGVLRGRKGDVRLAALKIAVVVATVAAVIMPITGDMSAKAVAVRQPAKLAAMESQFKTERNAPLRIGGVPNVEKQRVTLALEVPGGLSWLAFGDTNAEVKGLDKVPQADWPNVSVTHIAFQVMVAVGTFMAMVGLVYIWLLLRKKGLAALKPWPLRTLVIASPMGFIGLETGWIVTEVGRQPWMIFHVMRTSEAVTPASGLVIVFAGFLLLYALLGSVMLLLLSRLRHAY